MAVWASGGLAGATTVEPQGINNAVGLWVAGSARGAHCLPTKYSVLPLLPQDNSVTCPCASVAG